MKTLLFSLGILLATLAPTTVQATDLDFQSTLEDFQQSVTDESTQVDENAEGVTLPDFQSEDTEGANVILLALKRFLDFFKLLITPIAVLVAVIMGVRMVTAGKENEKVAGESKNFIKYALEGFIVILVADSLVNVFFGSEGEIFTGGQEGAQEFAQRSTNLFEGIYSLGETIIGAIAVFVLVMAGMRYVAGSYDEDEIGKAKKQIKWSLAGLFVIGISEFVVKEVIFNNNGQKLGIESAKQLFVNLTNFVSGTLGTLSFVFLLYAGYLYTTGVQNEDNTSKAKKIIFTALAGIVIAFAAYAITNTFVELDASR